MIKRLQRMITAGLCATTILAFPAMAEENWPQWRGASLNGISSSTDLPTTWSETENIAWKTPLPSWSASSPVVWGDNVFLMSPLPKDPANTDDAIKEAGGEAIGILCLSRKDGTIIWKKELDTVNTKLNKQNFSSPTPTTDGTHIWTVTGSGTVTALTMTGDVVWTHHMQEEYGPFMQQFGYACSPVLWDGKIILGVLHGFRGEAPSYLLVYDAVTGKELWRTIRPTDAVYESHDSYATPAILQYEGTTQIILTGGDCVTGHDLTTGKELWRVTGTNPENSKNWRVVSSPIVADGMIYAPTRVKPLTAIRAGGSGDITATHVAWRWDKQTGPDVPAPLCDGTFFYMVDDRGTATCLNAKTGDVIWGPEKTVAGAVSSSPLLADGNIYITNEKGITTVLKAGSAFAKLAEKHASQRRTNPRLHGCRRKKSLLPFTHHLPIPHRTEREIINEKWCTMPIKT